MALWRNVVVAKAPRNGTTSHTFDPSSSTGVVQGTPFTTTAGRLLVAVVEGAVTSSTPSGWTLLQYSLSDSGLYLFTKTAAGGSADNLTTTHNGSNYPVGWTVYEFDAGSSIVASAANTGALSGLSGTAKLVISAMGFGSTDATKLGQMVWTGDVSVPDYYFGEVYATTDGYVLSSTHIENSTASSVSLTFNSVGAGSREQVTFAVSVVGGATSPLSPIVQRASASGVTASALTVTLPATPTAGNTLVAVVNSDGTATITGTWNSRVTLVASQGFYVWDKTAGSSESPSVVITPGGAYPISVTFMELDAAKASTFDLAGTDTETNTQHNTRSFTSVTTTGSAGSSVFAIAALGGQGQGDSTYGFLAPNFDNGFWPAPPSVLGYNGTDPAASAQHFIGVKTLASAGAVGTTNLTWSNMAQDSRAIYVVYQPTPASSDYTSSPADNEGMTDSVTATLTGSGYTKSQADNVGLTDAVTVAHSVNITVADALGATDSANGTTGAVHDYTFTISDALGVTDTGSPQVMVDVEVIGDGMGLTDAVTVIKAVRRSPADTVGLTDHMTSGGDVPMVGRVYVGDRLVNRILVGSVSVVRVYLGDQLLVQF